ncbi:response regulator [Pseudoxanthomonas broegbernensis]|uniref:response regulator n=1 Tax=Pseudoxanthomonas broegbernensis TaxID=83619 RepID=UPI001391917B|nr:response regulator [Pseudoxanthomonas broegbernensis]MBB6064182.1 CheY-like chemotaxis protein [Pseudoxanthomonas broegbernensis]
MPVQARQPAATLQRSKPPRSRGRVRADPPRGQAAHRILVAEDQPINRAVISSQLQRLGYRHALAENGEQALRMLARGHFDLLLTDCHMPVLDGYALARRIRDGERDGRARLPIVALSASAAHDPLHRCAECGMDGFLGKPVHLHELRHELLRHLGPPGDAGPVRPKPETGPAPAGAADGPRLDRLVEAFGSQQLAARMLRQLLDAGRRDLAELDRALDTGTRVRQRELLHRIDGALRLLGGEGGEGPSRAGNRAHRDALARRLEELERLAGRLAPPPAGRDAEDA